MKVKAINNYCTLQIKDKETTETSFMVLPSSSSARQRWAEVLSVGPGVPDINGKTYPPDVQPGETVYVAAHGQYEIIKNENSQTDNLSAASTLDILAKLIDMNELTLQPLGQYIEIEKIEMENDSVMILPDSQKAPTNLGIVKTVGTGFRGPEGTSIPFHVKVGDKIVYNPLRTLIVDMSYLGSDVKKYLIMHNDIIGVVDEIS